VGDQYLPFDVRPIVLDDEAGPLVQVQGRRQVAERAVGFGRVRRMPTNLGASFPSVDSPTAAARSANGSASRDRSRSMSNSAI